MLAADYPFFDVLWTMVVFFVWVLWFWLLFVVIADIFRRHDLSGWGKAGWLLFNIVLPYIGVFVYLITQSDGIAARRTERGRAQQARLDEYVEATAGGSGASAEIEKARRLLDDGTITQAEFDALKRKALA
jgi:hypothetical protein